MKRRVARKLPRPTMPQSDNVVRTLQKMFKTGKIGELKRRTFLSDSTLRNLKNGKTRYPRHMTVTESLRLRGLKYEIVPMSATEVAQVKSNKIPKRPRTFELPNTSFLI